MTVAPYRRAHPGAGPRRRLRNHRRPATASATATTATITPTGDPEPPPSEPVPAPSAAPVVRAFRRAERSAVASSPGLVVEVAASLPLAPVVPVPALPL